MSVQHESFTATPDIPVVAETNILIFYQLGSCELPWSHSEGRLVEMHKQAKTLVFQR